MANVKKSVDFYLTSDEIESLDRLVEMGIYMNHAEAVRESMRHLFEFHGIPLLPNRDS